MSMDALVDPLSPECRPFEVRPGSPAERIMYCRDPVVLSDGPTNSGKTRPWLEKLFFCCEKWRCRGLLLRKYESHAAASVVDTWENQVVPEGHAAGRRSADKYGRPRYPFPASGSEVYVAGMYDGKAYNQAVMGTWWDFVIMDEGTQFTRDDFMRLNGRLDRQALAAGQIPFTQLGITTNPDAPAHWLWQAHLRGELTRINSRLQDNPQMHDGADWTDVGRRYLKRIGHYSGVHAKRNRDGLWVGAEGQIWLEWDDNVHLIGQMPSGWEGWWKYRSVDFGYAGAASVGWWTVDPDGRAYRYRELVVTGMEVAQLADRILELTGNEPIAWTVCDYAAPESMAVFRRKGIPCIDCEKPVSANDKDWPEHLGTVSEYLRVQPDGLPRLRVLRNCLCGPDKLHMRDPELVRRGAPISLAEQIPQYIWDPPREGYQPRERPAPEQFDHSCDETRYFLRALKKLGRSQAAMPIASEQRAKYNPDRHAWGLPEQPKAGGATWVSDRWRR